MKLNIQTLRDTPFSKLRNMDVFTRGLPGEERYFLKIESGDIHWNCLDLVNGKVHCMARDALVRKVEAEIHIL